MWLLLGANGGKIRGERRTTTGQALSLNLSRFRALRAGHRPVGRALSMSGIRIAAPHAERVGENGFLALSGRPRKKRLQVLDVI